MQIGALLIWPCSAGSLVNLAKQPASTVQILGAEKALFRALKTKHETPKYGLIYHASLIGQAPPKAKGKIARVLAAKCALSTRFDALGESADAEIGLEMRAKVSTLYSSLQITRVFSMAITTLIGWCLFLRGKPILISWIVAAVTRATVNIRSWSLLIAKLCCIREELVLLIQLASYELTVCVCRQAQKSANC